MKKAIVTALAALAALVVLAPAAAARGPERAEKSVNLVLAGDENANTITIGMTPDGRGYTIESSAPLEVGGSICSHPEANEDRIVCEAAPIAGFEVNGNGGNDTIALSPNVQAPATLRGGPGEDHLSGAAGADKIVGGPGNDQLLGRGGDDYLSGGSGEDRLWGGSGNDRLYGGPGTDFLSGGSGINELVP